MPHLLEAGPSGRQVPLVSKGQPDPSSIKIQVVSSGSAQARAVQGEGHISHVQVQASAGSYSLDGDTARGVDLASSVRSWARTSCICA